MKLLLFLIAVYALIARETTAHSKKTERKLLDKQAGHNANEINVSRHSADKEGGNSYYQNASVRMKDNKDRRLK